jgi:hypothetical protein
VRNWGKGGREIGQFLGCCNPTDFAIFPDGRFVTAEKGVPRVKVYSKEGEFINVVAGPDSLGEDAGGMDVAVKDGKVWVAMNRTGVIRVFEVK